MNNMNGMPSMEKPAENKDEAMANALINFQQLCEQFGAMPEPENASPELKAEMSKTKELIGGIKEKMDGLMNKSANWLMEKGRNILKKSEKYLPALQMAGGVAAITLAAPFFNQEGSHTNVAEIIGYMTIMITGLVNVGAGIYNSETYQKFEEEMNTN